MGYTRAEAERRIDHDKGAPDETVYAIRGQGVNAYHNNSDCRQLQRATHNPQAITRKMAHRRSLVPCAYCVLDTFEQSWSQEPDAHAKLIENARRSLQLRDGRQR